ncbi:hypothetical protein TI04_02010 [Achromatium sp. WMS2]|nr:hypothetical protein TI04_02010 [Achromatium sp. WMS2]
MRIAMGLEYDGSAYSGWQRQRATTDTIQLCVEKAIAKVANHPVVVHCAGRTDAGVHAREQVIHFDTTAQRSDRAWVLGCNTNLPQDINVKWAQTVQDNFHARFSAIGRHYCYMILNSPTRSALARQRALWTHKDLNVDLMRQGADYLIGTHDFSSYRAKGCQAKHPVRTIKYIIIHTQKSLINIEVGADAFLHHMVRNIVGVLIAIGSGAKKPIWAQQVLQQRNRALAGVTAPPYGLYLVAIEYPEDALLPV